MSLAKPSWVTEELFTSAPRVTVKFKLGQDKTFTLPFEIETSTSHLREQLSCILQVPLKDLSLSHDSKYVTDDQTLADFVTTRCGSIVMNLNTSHHIDVSVLFYQIYGDLATKDVISVTVEMGKGKEPKRISVEIVNQKVNKAFIGGYRHRLHGVEYHHASSQTFFPHSYADSKNKRFDRDTQTALENISKNEGTLIFESTQTPVNGLHLIEPLNKYITARKYVIAKELEEKASALQKNWRRWLLRNRQNSHRIEIQNVVKAREGDEERKRISKEMTSAHFPAVKEKVNWPMGEEDEHLKQATANFFSGKLSVFSNKFLLMKEIKQVMIHEKERKETMEMHQRKLNLNIVKKFCQPQTWIGKNGHTISMETEYHREFSKWLDVYSRFTCDELSTMERRKLIVLIKDMLEPNEDNDSLRIQDLLARQLDLIDAGVGSKHLMTLRKITEKYLLVFLEDYARKCFPKLQVDRLSPIKNRVYTCKICKRVKPESFFQSNSRNKSIRLCKSCFWVENMNRRRVDYGIYRHILRAVRREEEKRHCLFSTAFILQEEDIHYIVNTIWHGKSILSESQEIDSLRLCRFDNAVEWSPWNCFLVTHREMQVHVLVHNILEVYSPYLIEQVRIKHLMAQLHFRNLYNTASKHIRTKSLLRTKSSASD